jgi:TfoX N-terminal domain
MAYDEVLAQRIRDLIGPDPQLTERKMFGGLAFLIRGHMAISASGQGGVLVHVDPERSGELVAATSASVAVMRGREMPGWLRVGADGVATDDSLAPWVEAGLTYARSLPPKQAARSARKLGPLLGDGERCLAECARPPAKRREDGWCLAGGG